MSSPVSRTRCGAYSAGMSHEQHAEDAPIEQDAPVGGDETTEDELDADNPVEQDTLKTLDPDAPPA